MHIFGKHVEILSGPTCIRHADFLCVHSIMVLEMSVSFWAKPLINNKTI